MRAYLATLSVATVAVLALWLVLGMRIGVAAAAIYLAWPLVGLLLTIDDDLPGGWSNPDGSAPAPWRTYGFWGTLMISAGLTSVAFAIQWHTEGASPLTAGISGATLLALGAAAVRRDLPTST